MNNEEKKPKDFEPDYNVFSYEKFLLDLKLLKIDKICMTQIMNSEIMIATYGIKDYAAACKEVLTRTKEDVKKIGLSHCVIHYMYDHDHFIVAGTNEMSDAEFENLLRVTYDEYMLASADEVGLNAVSRFVLVFGKDDLVERAKQAFYLHRESQNNFLIATDEKEIMKLKNSESAKIFNLLNFAINNDTVIPYYQVIYANQNEEVKRYEALMRIYDEYGNIYLPHAFLEIAKEYKLYYILSQIMINKVLCDFDEKKSEVSINLTLLDIENEEFVTWFMNRMREVENPSKFTIEFVETENYNQGEKLYAFLNNVRKIGCKIAVDDFGAGFATLNSIILLRPDYLKIDGQIIQMLPTSEDSRIIVESICFMSKLINAKVVAEFVENDEIQEIVKRNNIPYSQGFLFAKPLPLVNLEIV